MIPICLWSGPRNVSTALMYSFAQRNDTHVYDEPLYAHYLKVSGALHPGREDVLAAMDNDGERVMRTLLAQEDGRTLHFMKHMAHHLVAMQDDFLSETRNVLLIRDPAQMLPSLVRQLPHASLDDTGLARQASLIETLQQRDLPFWVLDSRELLLDPEAVLGALCESMGIGFHAGMLSWPAGARSEDGVWAPHWYHAVHQSTGFSPYKPKHGFPEHLQPLLDVCAPYYEQLYKHAIRAPVANKEPSE